MSGLFGARAPELRPEIVQDLNIKPASKRKNPLHERSLSDLNRKPQPSIRLVDSEQDLKKRPLSSSHAQVGSQMGSQLGSKTRKQKESVYIDVPAANLRPTSRDGLTGPRSFLAKKLNRMSVSTTTSNADTLVAEPLFSPTSRRFSVDSAVKSQYTIEPQGLAAHLEPLRELSSDRPDIESDDMPDIPELPSSVPRQPRQMMRSSSVYSSGPFEAAQATPTRTRPRSSSSGLGFCVSPFSEESEEEQASGPARPSSAEFVAKYARNGSTPHIVRYVSSSESLQPQFASIRPAPYHSRSASSLWSEQSLESQAVAPLSIPRKRGHMQSTSLTTYPSITRLAAKHLSTITSEAEGAASTRVSQLDHALSSYRRRRTMTSSSYSESSSPRIDRVLQHSSSSHESVSSGIHSGAVMPDPLFSSSAPLPQQPFDPNSTHHTDELGDTICELPPVPLKEKRSGYFVRKRSQTELRPASRQSSHTPSESERWSTGTIIFPQWAKNFYTGRAQILSAKPSRVTLREPMSPEPSRMTIAGPPYAMIEQTTRSLDLPPPDSRVRHSRTETMATFSTFLTRPASGQSNWETIYTESPASKMVNKVFVGRRRSHTEGTIGTRKTCDSVMASPEAEDVRQVPSMGPSLPTKSTLRLTRPSLRHPLRQNPTGRVLPTPSRKSTMRSMRSNAPAGIDGQVVANGPAIATSAPQESHTISTFHMHSYASFPHLMPTRRLARSLTTAWRVPSIDEPFPAEMFARGNRQVVCFCLGFIFPPLWMMASFLALPRCSWREEDGVDGVGREKQEGAQGTVRDAWSWEDERKFLKARWWRNLNRFMSFIGVGIMVAIITLAVLASKG